MRKYLNFPKITVVTPCFNSEEFLEETILSVVNQSYPNLEYIIVDGGSTDGTLEIIKKYESNLAWWVSEPDQGMYDALNKGFSKSTGELMLWINSDDFLFPKSLFAIAKVFTDLPKIEWVQGMKVAINDEGIPLEIKKPGPFSYYSLFLNDYKWIQQESVVWKRSFYQKAGNQMNIHLKYAGDFELWTRMLRNSAIYFAPILIGGFRNQQHQLSKHTVKGESISEYEKEVNNILISLERPPDLEVVKKKNKLFLFLKHNLPARFSNYFLNKRYELLKYASEISWIDGRYLIS